MEELENIYGIGPIKAKELSNIIDIHKPIRSQLKNIKGLSKLTLADLKYNPCREIPRNEIDKILEGLKILSEKHIIAGSYRRMKPTSKDIDLIIKHKEFTLESSNNLIEKINKNKIFKIVHVYASGAQKMGVIIQKDNKYYKMDIFAATKNYTFMLLFGTGSYKFNIMMRAIAKKRGYLLNQHGLFNSENGQQIQVKNEKHLFNILNIKYRDPQNR
jgi:DNA polymerase/3'-5' exonuclease PolX